jgi:hypothetical protein
MPVFEKKTRKFAKGGKTTASMVELPNCNILVKGISKDVNGNKTVLLTFPNALSAMECILSVLDHKLQFRKIC